MRCRGVEAESAAAAGDGDGEPGTLREFKETAERAFLVAKLRENGWNISKTAEVIDTPRSNLYKKLEQYDDLAGDGRIGWTRRPQDARPIAALLGAAVRQASPAVRRHESTRWQSADRPSGREAPSGRKVRTPQGSAPGNARSGQPEGKWHRKYTALSEVAARADGEG